MGKFILREGVNTYIDGRDYGPGDEVELDDEQAKNLQDRGLVDSPEDARRNTEQANSDRDEQAKTQREAIEVTQELEANKVRAAEQNRAVQSQPVAPAARPSVTPNTKK